MRLVRLAAIILVSIAPIALRAAEPSGPVGISPGDENSIRDLEAGSWVAWKNHDAAFFERFLSADHVEAHSYGIVGKVAVVDGVRGSSCIVQSYSLGPFSLTAVAADTVLVTYRAEQVTACGEQKVPSPVYATSLYAKRAGVWVNVLYQHTLARG